MSTYELYDGLGNVIDTHEVPTELSRAERKADIQAEIDALERQDLAGRFVRESLLVVGDDLAERIAARMTAEGSPVTKQQVLAANVGYQKALTRNNQLIALRTILQAI